MIELTCALITGAILSMFFPNTRIIGIISIVVLTFLYPIPTVIVVLVGDGCIFLQKSIF